jgi:hypothetical protein
LWLCLIFLEYVLIRTSKRKSRMRFVKCLSSTETIALVQETDAMCLASYCFVNCLEFRCDDLCSVITRQCQLDVTLDCH